MNLFIHSQTSTVALLKFGNGWEITSHTLLGMWLPIHTGALILQTYKNFLDLIFKMLLFQVAFFNIPGRAKFRRTCLNKYRVSIFITRDSKVIMLSPCVFVCLCVSMFVMMLFRRFNYEGLVPHKQYFAGTLLELSSCANYVSRIHNFTDDVTRSQSSSNF